MVGNRPSTSQPVSLAARIRQAERQVAKRQRGVDVQSGRLVRQIHQQMTAPGTLLLAGGIGFIIGELTKRQTPKMLGAVETTPWRTALNLATSAHTLYTALPLAWIVKSFHSRGTPDSNATQQENDDRTSVSSRQSCLLP
jgi:hypothetical protein